MKNFPYKFYNEEEITDASQLSFLYCRKHVAHYIRDLFVHEYDANVIQEAFNFIVFLDNRIIGLVGVNRAMGPAVNKYFHALMLFFAIGKQSKRYPKLSKLVVLGATTTGFKKVIGESIRSLDLHDFQYIRSACWSRFPEIKVDRGILKLESRQKLPDGRFKLLYTSDFRDMTLSEAVQFWLRRWGK
jgi:hypothetical protein